MNPNNYGTRPACKRLHDAGIVVETDQQWYRLKNGDWYLSGDSIPMIEVVEELPALSMAGAWRELPDEISHKGLLLGLFIAKFEGRSYASYSWHDESQIHYDNTNPTDALIDLLIWVRKEKPDPRGAFLERNRDAIKGALLDLHGKEKP